MKKMHYVGSLVVFLVFLIAWESISQLKIVPEFLLPSVSSIIKAIIQDFPILMLHLQTSLIEAVIGLIISVLLALGLAFSMDASKKIYHLFYPFIIVSQTIPTVAIAPLLVLWFGYDLLPKIILITLVCFFPMTMSVLTGLQEIDVQYIRLFKTFQSNTWQMIKHLKIPFILPHFFTGLKVAVSYAIVGAIIAEWLGGNSGLGVYMTRVRKSFSFDKMFAVILLTSVLSLLLVGIIALIEKKVLHYKALQQEK